MDPGNAVTAEIASCDAGRRGCLRARLVRGVGTLLLTTWAALLAPAGLAAASAAAAPATPATTGADRSWEAFATPWFDTLSIADGLPHSITTSVVQDGHGLIWFGTMGGLVRYDGHRLQIFGARTENAPGLPDAYVRALLALPDGGLLIGTNAGGLTRFQPNDNSFHDYPVGVDGLAGAVVYALADDGAGGAWIASNRGLDHLDVASGHIARQDLGSEALPRNFSVLQDRAGNLWLGNDGGTYLRRAGRRAFEKVGSPDPVAATVLANQTWALHEDAAGRIWVGSVRAGSAWRDEFGRWHGVPGASAAPQQLYYATVRAFLEFAPGRMWIATDGAGIVDYVVGEARARDIVHDQAVPSSLPGNTVRALLRDRSGNIWAATDLGIARHNTLARTALTLQPSPVTPHSLADGNVSSLMTDSRGRVWAGLGEGRIDVLDPAHGTIRHLRHSEQLGQRNVLSLAESGDGTIWAGLQGLVRIDPDSLAIRAVGIPALDAKPILSLHADGERLLIGTYDGLYRYTPRSGALEHVGANAGPGSLVSNVLRRISHVGGIWWYATNQGFSIARGEDSLPPRFLTLQHDPARADSLPQDFAGAVVEDRAGRIWLGTLGGAAIVHGLGAASEAWRFQVIDEHAGLASNKVIALLPDADGSVWASLSNGIARIDADGRRAVNLGLRDGLHVASYVNIAATRAPGGDLLFGGLGGITVIRPHWRAPPVPAAPLVVTRAVVNGIELPFGRLDAPSIAIADGGRNLRVGFALLDYQAPQETVYSYRMVGLEDDWTVLPPGSRPVAIYTNLPHGDYQLQMRAETRGLNRRTTETALAVRVAPRWYETLLARLLASLAAIGLIAGLVQLRTYYLRRRALHLQQLVEERTRDLVAANRRLDELANTDSLTGIYNRRHFLELVGHERRRDHGAPPSIALFDLDHFKHVNDSHGHLAGDAVIRGAVDVIRSQCRHGDLLGRFGGEEFVLYLPETSAALANEIGTRICAALAARPVDWEGRKITATISIGVAELRTGETTEAWLSRADEALYEAKRAGRNRCMRAA